MGKASTSANGTAASIRFILDGELIELADVDPTRTVLQFLREDLRRTGTKEGCAEGDCGACTVAVCELNPDADDVSVSAINSCIQFLPTLDGKELVTVESLSSAEGGLHPVQQALVDCHASQCGFCTPGFVMSLFALYKNAESPGRRQIDDALAGNLCRCTGYRPIIAAAQQMYQHVPGEDWLRQPCGRQTRPAARIEKLKSIAHSGPLSIKSGGRRFHAPRTAEQLAAILAQNPGTRLLAGGTDVGLWVTKQHREFDELCYTGNVDELNELRVTAAHVEIGAAVALRDAGPALLEHYPELDEVFLRFASPPIRNAATLGGNIANGSPIGDSMPALMVLGASLVLRSAAGVREVPLDDFYKDYMVNDLRAGEFIQTVRVPLRQTGVELRSYKISKRFDQDISAVCAAFSLQLDGERVTSARVAYGGMAATVRRARHCEKCLTGAVWDDAAVKQGMQALARDFSPIDDMRSTAAYRLRVAQNLLRRLLLETRGELTDAVYRYGRTA